MALAQALDMPPEIWFKIASFFRPKPVYYVGGCCGGPHRPSPGADTVGPLPSSAPPKDLISLSCVCRILRLTFEGNIKAFISLRIRYKDEKFIHQRGSIFSSDDEEKKITAKIHELPTLPLGDHILHLSLALREPEHRGYNDLVAVSQKYCDGAAPILYETPRLQSLMLSARFVNSGDDFNLSPAFCRALSSLRDLHTIRLWGLSIPPDCPTLDNLVHIQTNAKIHSFESLPRLRDLRQDPDMFAPGYYIPSNTLARLEVLHYCSPDYIDERALLPQVCRDMKGGPTDHSFALRELVLNGYPNFNELRDIVHALASPHLHTFVCFGLYFGDKNKDGYEEVVEALKKACPNLTTLDFPKPGHKH